MAKRLGGGLLPLGGEGESFLDTRVTDWR